MSDKYRNQNPKPTANAPRGERAYNDRRITGKPTTRIQWLDVDAERLQSAVNIVAENGGCIILSKTSDGGALSCTVITGNDRLREWPASVDAAHEVFDGLKSYFGDD